MAGLGCSITAIRFGGNRQQRFPVTVKAPFTWRSSARTDPGCVREVNEDAFLERPDIGLWVVADGMGGHEAGDVASRLLVDHLARLGPQARMSTFVNEVEGQVLDETLRLVNL